MNDAEPTAIDLTPLQFGMIYHHLREGGESGADVVQVETRLAAPVDVDRLREAWDLVVHRHPSLRLSFRWEGEEEPSGRIAERLAVAIQEVDFAGESDGEARFDDALKADRARGFDLTKAPVFRLTLFDLGGGDARLVWTLHHLLADGASYRIVLDEVFTLYDSTGPLDASILPERPAPDAFLKWMKERDGSGDEAFWRGLLGRVRETTTLPRQAGGQTDPGAWKYLKATVDRADTAKLRALADAEGVTLHSVVQAAWALTLARFSGRQDVMFGAIRGGRAGTVDGVREMVGLFIQTVPIPVDLAGIETVGHLLKALRKDWTAMRGHEHASPSDLQRWSSIPSGQLLFESVLNFQDPFWGDPLLEKGGPWKERSVDLHNRLVFPLTIAANAGDELRLRFEFDPAELDEARLESMFETLQALLRRMCDGGSQQLSSLRLLSDSERDRIVRDWNRTDRELAGPQTVHQAFEATVEARSDEDAVVTDDERWSYRRLEEEANRVAHALRSLGVRKGDRVAVAAERSLPAVAALLGTLKAGAAYVPVDPRYPRDRVRLMLEDSRPSAVLTDRTVRPTLPATSAPVLAVDDVSRMAAFPVTAADIAVEPSDLAYMIYTSGSTGKPKGVMVEHGNVINFFAGMDDAIGTPEDATWLAVTSVSFDISVLELLWTLARGARVALYPDRAREAGRQAGRRTADAAAPGDTMAFSLFYFSAEGEEGQEPPPPGRDRYRLLLEGAKFADENGLAAVWTPERHFHEFGGIYPNPSVAGAAVAAITERVRIRAGSVVLPLHDPMRVAEEWSVVDNLSNGRVDLSFASGWHDRDFIFRPEAFENRKDGMFEGIDTVQRLWRGEAVDRKGPSGNTHALRLYPRPVQNELPVWITAGGSPETFRKAGEAGGHLLTHLLGQKPQELKEKIEIYREAWKKAGHAGRGHVSLMLHTFIGPDMDFVRERTKTPFRNYLRTAVGLIKAVAKGEGQDLRDAKLSDDEMDALLDHAFNRYFETSSLMGTPDRCAEIVQRMSGYGVDEIACLIDFGVDDDDVLEGLKYLPELMARSNAGTAPTTEAIGESPARAASAAAAGNGAPALPRTVSGDILRTGASRLQCTPSQAALLLAEPDADEALRQLDILCIGGEAFPGTLAARLRSRMKPDARLFNMYGPTETTIWSSVREVRPEDCEAATVPLGKPIANTRLLVLDEAGEPVPVGVDGELLIGGAGVTRGYFDREELTKQRFVDSSVPEWPGRLYRTGDRARWKKDGTLDFLGRVDQQVKLLGHRIEPAEVEAALVTHPDVREAVVTLWTENGAAETARLVAYIVPRAAAPERETLRNYLRERLPEVMVPADFVEIASVPLTPNGKTDRARLPNPGEERARRVSTAKAAPMAGNSIEGEIAKIWSEALGLAEVGPEDNFFEIGGHSLLAVRVHSRLTQRFDGTLTLIDLFRFPTVRALAKHLGASGADEGEELVQDARDRAASRRKAMRGRGAGRRGGR